MRFGVKRALHFAPSMPSAGGMSPSTVNHGMGSGFQPNFSIRKADLHVSVRDGPVPLAKNGRTDLGYVCRSQVGRTPSLAKGDCHPSVNGERRRDDAYNGKNHPYIPPCLVRPEICHIGPQAFVAGVHTFLKHRDLPGQIVDVGFRHAFPGLNAGPDNPANRKAGPTSQSKTTSPNRQEKFVLCAKPTNRRIQCARFSMRHHL